ncbi:hypothetical protein DC498_24225 [Terrimonas sp.]|nr:hypothetical protein DC498_24225 [Terrimonas sp.]
MFSCKTCGRLLCRNHC